jgi:hypothetical protein
MRLDDTGVRTRHNETKASASQLRLFHISQKRLLHFGEDDHQRVQRQ